MLTTQVRVAVGLVCGALLAACAPNKPSLYKLADPKDRVICREETPTGSIIPKTRCVTLKQLEAEQEAARREMSTASQKSNTGTPR